MVAIDVEVEVDVVGVAVVEDDAREVAVGSPKRRVSEDGDSPAHELAAMTPTSMMVSIDALRTTDETLMRREFIVPLEVVGAEDWECLAMEEPVGSADRGALPGCRPRPPGESSPSPAPR